ncbi:uncharacterized protein LOC141658460 [Silene latifolia]|uniref:uncharacterized protein LOC141658460 n=1 Tax=Silene latifolia TaxID=37657 RepID=UPI003D76F720
MEEPIIKGDYKFLREFNLGDHVFLNKATAMYFPILSPVTDSRQEEGLCGFYATTDVIHTLLTIHEATLPGEQSQYFDSRFMDTPSVGQLLDTGLQHMSMLQKYVSKDGLTSKEHYTDRAKTNSNNTKITLTGCIRYKTSEFKTFRGDDLHASIECIEGADFNDVNDNFPDACINHIRRYGPVVGVFDCMMDSDLICEMPIYESKVSEFVRTADGVVLAHAVMITGYGLAIHLPTGRMITYYVIQNNWGKEEESDNSEKSSEEDDDSEKKEEYVGRLPCNMFHVAYGHKMDKQQDLIQFSENEDTSNIAIIKKEFLKLAKLPSC